MSLAKHDTTVQAVRWTTLHPAIQASIATAPVALTRRIVELADGVTFIVWRPMMSASSVLLVTTAPQQVSLMFRANVAPATSAPWVRQLRPQAL